jgi:Tol biopolymer transport system component
MQKQNRFGLYVAKIDTGVVLEVLPDPPYDAPVWSPDSRKLAVSTRRWVSVDVSEPGCSGPREEITYYIFDVESGQLVEVTRGYLVGTGTFWLANNSVVFRFEKAPCAGGYFYRFGADGRNGVRLGEKGMCCSEGFSLAPNKETIAYWSYVFGQKKGENYVELYTVDTRHLTWRLVLRVPEDTVLSASAVIWLPSRNMVAFELDQSVWSGSRTVCVADLQTGTFYQIAGDYSTLKPFVNDLYYATVEAVAPSEQWIVIRGSKQAKAGRLYLFNLDEDKLIDVAPGLFYDSVDWKVEWAPSARRFAFSGREIDGQEQNVYNVYIVDTTGRVSRTIRNVGVYSWGWAPR